MGSPGLLSNHGRVLLPPAHDPGMRLRDIAGRLGITERSTCGIVADLTAAGYISKHRHGRRNHYQIGAHQPLPGPASRERTAGKSSPCSRPGSGPARRTGGRRSRPSQAGDATRTGQPSGGLGRLIRSETQA